MYVINKIVLKRKLISRISTKYVKRKLYMDKSG